MICGDHSLQSVGYQSDLSMLVTITNNIASKGILQLLTVKQADSCLNSSESIVQLLTVDSIITKYKQSLQITKGHSTVVRVLTQLLRDGNRIPKQVTLIQLAIKP